MPDRFIVGDPVHLENSFYNGSTLTDPTTVTLAVTDPSGTTDTYTYAGGGVTKASTGVYYRNHVTDEDGVWEFTWTATGTVVDTSSGSVTVWPVSVDDIDVLTLPEAKKAVGLNQTDTDTDDYLRTLITAVSAQLDQLCGPVRNRTITDEAHDGGCWTIQLNRVPVYSITTVTEYASTTGTVLAAETNAAKAAGNYLHDGRAGTVVSGLLRRRSGGADQSFTSGRRNVVVTYVAGRAANTEVVPAKFKQAAAMMLRNLWVAEMASGSQTIGALVDDPFNPLLGPGMLNKVVAILQGEMLDGVMVG